MVATRPVAADVLFPPSAAEDLDMLQPSGTRDIDQAWLRAADRLSSNAGAPRIAAADLFSGCGGMSIGLQEAARRLGASVDVRLAVESDKDIAGIYDRNIGAAVSADDVQTVFDGTLGQPMTERERATKGKVGELDILLGGPPCQGHSDLNNHTRRSDPKNGLYIAMARAAEVLEPRVIVIENVPPVQWDSGDVVTFTREALEGLGYSVAGRVINCFSAGVPQHRRRYILVASTDDRVRPAILLASLAAPCGSGRTVHWAIGDLEDIEVRSELDRPSRMSEDNAKRVEYLTKQDVLDLPNTERPKCHRDDPDHSYKSMYGRLAWDAPAQTITTGFTSMGQGRFVHPSQPRTLTPHEAARLQTFPDWFDWGDAKRTKLTTMIGNAVPPLLMVAIGMHIIAGLRRPDTA